MVKHLCTPIFATIQIPFGRIVKISDGVVSRHEFTEPLIVYDLYIFINFNFIFKINISPICLRSFIGILTNAGWSWLIDIINIMTAFLDYWSLLSSKVRINSLWTIDFSRDLITLGLYHNDNKVDSTHWTTQVREENQSLRICRCC